METRNFLGNLRVEMCAVGIPTALRRAGKAARCNGREGRAEKNAAAIKAIQKAESHDVSQSDSQTFSIRFWPATRSHSFPAVQPWRRGRDQSSDCVRA